MFIDFVILPSDFNDTTITFVAETTAAKARFDGAISIQVRKNAAPSLADQLEAQGFTVRTA
jgi:hypothetical protein